MIKSLSPRLLIATLLISLTVASTIITTIIKKHYIISTQLPSTLPNLLTEQHPTAVTKQGRWQLVIIKNGDSLATIFSHFHLGATILNTLMNLPKTDVLKQLKPGEKLNLLITSKDILKQLTYTMSQTHSFIVWENHSGWHTKSVQRVPRIKLKYIHATIDDSFYLAARQAGLSDNLTMQLADILGWEIDFAHGIHQGDHFDLLYEAHYLKNKKIDDGHIVAIEFTNRNKTYYAIRFTDPAGNTNYYNKSGINLKKPILRAPVRYTRISSRFVLARAHPILHIIRAHKGVDYAAPYGTPIKAAGSGIITAMGWNGGYGKAIDIQHNLKYSTRYGHMMRFANGLKKGSYVTQGQVIGYVGSTGLATGPHVHYEIHVYGIAYNPLTIALPSAQPMNKTYLSDFQAQANRLLAELNANSSTQLVTR